MKTKKPTIYQIARGNDCYYFSRETLRFFGQTLSSFSVYKTGEAGVYKTSAERPFGESICYWRDLGLNKFERLGSCYKPEGGSNETHE
jgi:hypothetical protein